ncbi:YqbF domain-containing protein [Shouchella clausii]|uniref:YqbF domain-containing protein n=1 Tax=Shouchella clausii TaxID=79880 RepID=UPI001C73B68F|nr:YqbF domain-containing protein [Shouchella clausii]MBX0319757.1 hypothetical protein [Shouchella clausii]
MYKATLKTGQGKTYDVGGVVFKENTPKEVENQLGEYLSKNPCFQVEKVSSKKGNTEDSKTEDTEETKPVKKEKKGA